MSTADIPSGARGVDVATGDRERRWQRLEDWLESVGEGFNPILVKETRQALKSRQFLIAFSLLLIASWIWTLIGSAQIGEFIYTRPSGRDMFFGYYLILLAALGVVVPYMSFRSLVAESDENTYDLLSITTLTPRQIIAGKLGSSIVQMAVYLAAVAPCMAFTYLLRGIDIFTIGLILVYTVFGSIGLSMLGLLLASMTRVKFVQVVLSMAVVVGLIAAYVGGAGMTAGMLRFSGRMINTSEFFLVCLFIGTIYTTTFAIVFLAAASRITFESENRATALRIACLVQYLAISGWIIIPWIEVVDRTEVAIVFVATAAMYWYVIGIFTTSESPRMSRRVMRQLPSRLPFRYLFFWFMPGPATGYIFSLAGVLSASLMALTALKFHDMFPDAAMSRSPWRGTRVPVAPDSATVFALGIICWSYVAIFLGVCKLLVGFARKFTTMNLLLACGIHFIIVGAAVSLPFVIESNIMRRYSRDYTLLHISNPFYTLESLGNSWKRFDELWTVATILACAAIVVLLANLKSIATEMARSQIVAPKRIAEDEVELEEIREPSYKSPWD